MLSQNKLGAATEDRKARLAQLRSLKRKHPEDEVAAPESERSPSPQKEDTVVEDTDTSMYISGRNYDAETRGPKLGFEAPPTLPPEKATLEQQAAERVAEVAAQAAKEAEEDKGIDLFKLQPKRPNWDLKRNLERKMEVLNVRTDNAIARLVRERITGQQEAARQKSGASNTQVDGEAVGMDGVALVEGLRVREKEEEEEERREREEMEEPGA